MEKVLAALSIVCSIYLLVKVLVRKKKNSVPYAGNSWPLLGHLPLLRGSQPAHIVLGELVEKYGSIFMIKLGINPAMVVSDWEIAKECFTVHDRVFASRPTTVPLQYLSYNNSMFGLGPYGDFWRQTRKLVILELLSNQRLWSYRETRESEVRNVCRELYKLWEARTDDSSRVAVEMKSLTADLTFNIVFKIIFGKTLGYTTRHEDDNPLKEWKLCFTEYLQLLGKFTPGDAFPFLRFLDIGNDQKAMESTMEKLDAKFEELLNQHKARRSSDEGSEDDFMGVMLSIFDKPENVPDGRDPDTVIKGTCLAMTLGGSDTTSSTLAWALALLVNHPDVLKKAQQEVDDEVGKDRMVSEADTTRFPYLEAVIKETMRLYPTAPLATPRLSLEDCTVAGYHVPAGTTVHFNLAKIQRDPRVWEEPNEFRPERFLSLHKDMDLKGQNFELIPFGSGRRICPGINFALLVLRLALASIIHGFDFGSSSPIDMSEAPGITSSLACNLDIFLTPRLPSEAY